MRADRLLSLMLLLRSRGRLAAPELARRLEVSERTVLRDVAVLGAAGIPVYTERGRHGGIGLLPGFRTEVPGLTPDEAAALFAHGGRAAGGLDDAALRSALGKLLAALPATTRPAAERAGERVVIDPTGWRRPAGVEELPWLAAVRAAVWADRRLRLRYRRSDRGPVVDRTVDPYGLLSKGGVWYLIAAHRGRPRLFRVSRLEQVRQTGAVAARPAGLDLEALWLRLRAELEQPAAPVPVTLRVRSERTALLLRITAAQLAGPPGEPRPDGAGWERLTLPFRALGAARGVLLGLGTDIEVLAPPELHADLAATARAVVELYALRKRASRKQ